MRGLMFTAVNYAILALALVLTAAGSVAFYNGYDIVEIERGWTEVIAGTTALCAGIVILTLWMILQKLQSLSDLYAAGSHPSAAEDVIAEPAFVAPPDMMSPLASVLPARTPAASAAQEQPAEVPPGEAQLASLRVAAFAPASAPLLKPVSRQHPAVQNETPADSDALPAPARAGLEPLRPVPIEATETAEQNPVAPEPPRRAASALSIEDMWKRVAGEMEKPIFSPRHESVSAPSFRAEHTAPVSEEALAARESVSDNMAATAQLDVPSEGPDLFAEPEPPVETLAPRLEPLVQTTPHQRIDAAAASQQEFALSDDELLATWPMSVPTIPAPEPSHPAPAPSAPTAEPAVLIGRYEAEGTAYLMFADGSIEAQSEAGIFHFASMAELKAFIEGKQVAET